MSNIEIVIPMAGYGSRFFKEGYSVPKPLIDVNGKAMIGLVIENLKTAISSSFTFIALKEHEKLFGLEKIIGSFVTDFRVIWLDEVTSGAAQTALIGCEGLNPESPLVIANSDQYVSQDLLDFMKQVPMSDGLIMTMPALDPKWSYVLRDRLGNVTKVVEKQVVSNEATVGIYGFRKLSFFVDAANSMITAGEKVGGEYYVAPSYNYLIEMGKSIKTYNVGSEMHGLGTPEDLESFMNWQKK
jgi:NDP-sugar pyrophosphorylase family protein